MEITASDDLVARLRALSQRAAFNTWLGLEIVRAAPGEVELRLAWRPEFGQYDGFMHAGIIGGLLDTACGFAAASMVGNVLASHFSVRCMRPAVADVFTIKGHVLTPGRLQVFTTAELYGGDPSKPLAVGDALLVPVEPPPGQV